MRRALFGLTALLFATGGLGCASLGNLCGSAFHQPSLTFERVEIRDLSLAGATIDLHFLLHNDNPVAVSLASLAYDFRVENHPVISGHPANGVQVRANGVSDLSFPAHVAFAQLASTVQVFLTQDVASYTASGSVGVRTPVGIVTFPLSHTGTFKVPKLPTIQVQPPKLTRLSITGAHLNVPIVVHNRNAFALPFNGLATQVTLSGAPVVAPAIAPQSALAANQSRVINLGADVNFLQSGLAVANAIRNKRVVLGLHGALTVAGLRVPIDLNKVVNLQ